MDHLEEYIRIVSADYSDFDGYTERHHIIPSSGGRTLTSWYYLLSNIC